MDHTRIIHIDSRQRTTGVHEDCNHHIEPLLVKKIQVESIQIPYSWYPINETNNVINWERGGNEYSAEVPPGNYTIDQLGSELKSVMDAEDNNNYNLEEPDDFDTQQKLSITGDTVFELQFGTFKVNSIATVLGFNQVDTGDDTTHVADNIYNLQYDNYILLVSNIAVDGRMIRVNNTQHNVLLKIPVDGNFGDIINYYNDQISYDIDEIVSDMNFRLYFQDGRFVNLNGRDWSMTLKLIY